jgi:hypothetical protein
VFVLFGGFRKVQAGGHRWFGYKTDILFPIFFYPFLSPLFLPLYSFSFSIARFGLPRLPSLFRGGTDKGWLCSIFCKDTKCGFGFCLGASLLRLCLGFTKFLFPFFPFCLGCFLLVCLKGDLCVAKELGFRVSAGNRLGVGT